MKTIYISGCFLALGFFASWAYDSYKRNGLDVTVGLVLLFVSLVLCSWIGAFLGWFCGQDDKAWFNKRLFFLKKKGGNNEAQTDVHSDAD